MQQLLVWSPFIILIVVFYLMILVPENRRKKKYNTMVNSLKVNDEIVTRGGIMGKIVNMQDDFVILQTGPDKARIKLAKNGIASVVENSTQEK